jgi:hypothetical protein
VGRGRRLTLLLAALAGAPAALAGTGAGQSELAILDTRAPDAELIAPEPAEILILGETYRFRWSIAEDHFAAEGEPVTLEILADGEPIHVVQLPAAGGGDYAYDWPVAGDASSDAAWRIAAVDAFGNAAVDSSGPFYIAEEGNAAPPAPPARAAFLPNHPNPFNPVTRLRFALPAAGRARLAIHDVRGRRVALLVDGELDAGWHARDWRADGLPSGVYLARLEAGGAVLSRKLVLLR